MSSNYSTSYNISQSGDLYTLQDHGTATGLGQYNSTRGTTVNSPVNYRRLMAFKGLDNEFWFYVKNQDRKPVYLFNLTINAALINRETGSRVLTKQCIITDSELGTCRLVLTDNDIALVDTGLYDLVLTYTNDKGLVLPLFIDMNLRPNYTVEISGVAHQIPLITQTSDVFLSDGAGYYVGSGQVYGPSSYDKSQGLVTVAAYCTGYTGKFYVQGTTSQYPVEADWFNIELGAAVDHHQFTAFTGIEPFIFTLNLKFMCVKWEDTGTGTVDKVLFRL
jgi:hypothetical protein